MKVLTVCMKYPTLLQTWFVNYLEGTEKFSSSLSVISLQPGEQIYDERIDCLNVNGVYFVNGNPETSYRNLSGTIFKNLLNRRLWSFAKFILHPSYPLKDKIKSLKSLAFIEIEKPSLIHCHSEKAAYRLLPLLKSFDVPLVVTFHGLTPEGVSDISPTERKTLYKNVDKVIVNTKFARDQFRSITTSNVKVDIIKQGIPLEKFRYQPTPFPHDQNFTAITVGRLDRLKGHRYAIEAVGNLLERGVQLTYLIVGSGLYESELKKQVINLGLQDNIKFLGSQTGEQLIKLYQQSHFFILPSFSETGSWAETQGIVVQEAQASGVLTLCSSNGGIPECVNDGHDAFLFSPQSSLEIADKIIFLINNAQKWSQWQANARNLVEEQFSIAEMSDSLHRTYKSIIQHTPDPPTQK